MTIYVGFFFMVASFWAGPDLLILGVLFVMWDDLGSKIKKGRG